MLGDQVDLMTDVAEHVVRTAHRVVAAEQAQQLHPVQRKIGIDLAGCCGCDRGGEVQWTSFTNATAFSPTDTMPLTVRVKMLMLAQSMVALITIRLVAARAVNVLA
jgi:hypothetical protein